MKPWTELHQREARARMREIAAERERIGESLSLAFSMGSAGAFADWLCDVAGRSDAAREVRRVRALAEGRLVRDTIERWGIRSAKGWRAESGAWCLRENAERMNQDVADRIAKMLGNGAQAARLSRLTCIRRRTT